MNKISVIIPVKEEMKLKFHHKIIDSYRNFNNCELLWVIGPNSDGTHRDLLDKHQNVVQTTSNSRAERINIGFKEAQNSLILLNHPRSFLSAAAISDLGSRTFGREKYWGGFTHEFYQVSHPALKFTSLYSNHIRFDRSGIVYLDHCIFFTRNLIARGDNTPVPEVDIFEDTLFSQKLLKRTRPLRIKSKSYTSPVRFTTNGVFRQSILNQKLKFKYQFGFSTRKMNQDYEKNLNLNSEY